MPFRKNCEGYFFDKKKNILAKQINEILVFPGGGVDDNESPLRALIRETFEETGAIVRNLKKLEELKFVWGKTWAKTEKQKKRYKKFYGEDMSFFVGEIDRFEEPKKKEEDFWEGEKLVPIKKAIELLESKKPFDEEIREYREIQLKFLKKLYDRN